MSLTTRRAVLALALLPLSACGAFRPRPEATPAATYAGNTPAMQSLVRRYARSLQLPEALLHQVIRAESGYNPGARNGPYYGLMQIHPDTARTMGYDGPPSGLLDAETNIRYAGAYLRGAWIVADGDMDEAYGWYRRGYYYEARDRGLLEETGLRRG